MAKKTKTFPIEVKSGSVTVKIYDRKPDFQYYRVCYHIGGKRVMKTFAELDGPEGARNEAEIQAAKLSQGDIDGALLTGKDRLIYCRAQEAVAKFGVALDAAAIDYAAARDIAGDVAMADMARYYAKHHSGKIVSKSVADVVKELVADAKFRKMSKRYIEDLGGVGKDLGGRCGAFAKAFHCPINTIGAEDIRAYLQKLNGAPRTYNNHVTNIHTLFNFAKSRKYVAKDSEAMDGITKIKDKGGKIEIYTPAEIDALLAHASADLVPVLAIGAFAGLRTEEILRLDWAQVSLTDGKRDIEVMAGNSKTASRRLVPVSDNLAAWLAGHAKKSGSVWPHSRPFMFEAIRDTAKTAKVTLKSNAARHSFISYRLAEVQDVGKVALEAGNSPKMIFQNYRELVRQADAKNWFAVSPKQPANVVKMKPPIAA